MSELINIKENFKFTLHGHTVTYFPHYHKAVLDEAVTDNAFMDKTINIKCIEPNDWLRCARLAVIPTNRCNFHCTYCFSDNGRKRAHKNELTIESFCRTVDNWVGHLRKIDETPSLFVRFLGGGEPLMCPDLIVKGTEYLQQKYPELPKDVRIVSNGYFLNNEIILWALKNDVMLELSYDILEDVHNAQRNNYFQILNNIKLVDEKRLRYRLRSVVTNLNIDRMTEMVEQAKHDFPNLNFIQMELVSSDNIDDSAFEKFVKGFFKARLVAEKLEVTLGCSKIDSFNYPRLYHCVPEFCLNQDGEVTFCHRFSSHDEPYFYDFYFGKELEKIDVAKVANVLSNYGYSKECNKCIAKYHCAGGCYHNNLYMSSHKDAFCKYRILSVRIQALRLASERLFLQYINSHDSMFEFNTDSFEK